MTPRLLTTTAVLALIGFASIANAEEPQVLQINFGSVGDDNVILPLRRTSHGLCQTYIRTASSGPDGTAAETAEMCGEKVLAFDAFPVRDIHVHILSMLQADGTSCMAFPSKIDNVPAGLRVETSMVCGL